jgi:hypothetical protein
MARNEEESISRLLESQAFSTSYQLPCVQNRIENAYQRSPDILALLVRVVPFFMHTDF